jgi:uncharacterized glyoxalase superfamily protein PhnB
MSNIKARFARWLLGDRADTHASTDRLLPTKRATIGELQIDDVAENPPEFKRQYNVALTNGFRVQVTLYTTSYGERREYYSKVSQPDGRSMLFDVRRVADKIIDPTLLPFVQTAADQILAFDRAFVESRPNRFTDKSGVVWQRSLA